MGSFNLDIEKFFDELAERSQQLKGIFCIQYPVYCIHSNISDITPDPLDNLDKAISDFFISKSDFTPFQISSLMGTSKSLIEKRIVLMIQDRLMTLNDNSYLLTDTGIEVFKDKTKIRQHKLSYDFYIDGLTLKPLSRIFYTYYRNKFISEFDSFSHTNLLGDTYIIRPFGPDLVHTPPNKEGIIESIFSIEQSERESYYIPTGLQEIEDISFTKLSLQLLISVSYSSDNKLVKELIDGFAMYSLSENLTYYESVRKNILSFEKNIQSKIENLEFKINIPRQREDQRGNSYPIITTNWQEIDKYNRSQGKCFSFSSEDLLKVVEQIFQINQVAPESIINEDCLIELSINKNILLNSPDRQKLINDLIRERDYKIMGNLDYNVFLLYLYFKTKDSFVQSIIDFKKTLNKFSKKDIKLNLIEKICRVFSSNYRELFLSAGEYELLEELDIEKYMIQLD